MNETYLWALLIVGLIFWVWQFNDLITRYDEDFVGRNDKLIWAIVLVVLNFFGALLYFFGKPSKIPLSNQTLRDGLRSERR